MTAVIDPEGRVFGRVNLIDAAIGVAVLVLLPLAYGAFLLFRPPAPRITSVEKVAFSNTEERTASGANIGGKLKVRGSGLRPNMRAEIGDRRAIAFVFETPASADVIYGSDVPPGTHDFVLFDGVQEIARATAAVTIAPGPARPSVRVRIVGTLIDLDETRAKALQADMAFPDRERPQAEIVALERPETDTHRLAQSNGAIEVPVRNLWQRPAAVVVGCDPGPAGCLLGGVSLGGAQHQVIAVPGAPDLKLRIDEILPTDLPRPASARVRFVAARDAASLVMAGDRDRGNPALTLRSATIESVASRSEAQGNLVTLAPGSTGQVLAWAVDRVVVVEASIRMSVDGGSDGWRYRSQPVKAGAPFTFETSTYVLQGTMLRMAMDGAEPAHGAR